MGAADLVKGRQNGEGVLESIARGGGGTFFLFSDCLFDCFCFASSDYMWRSFGFQAVRFDAMLFA